MDPNEALKELRQLAASIARFTELVDCGEEIDLTEEAVDMAVRFQALDKWITDGGFFPAVWLVHQHGQGRERRE